MSFINKIKAIIKKVFGMSIKKYRPSGTVKGMTALGSTLIKSIFSGNRWIYRCPTCNLVLKTSWRKCPRCGTYFDWIEVI
jgi:hypothetical protein